MMWLSKVVKLKGVEVQCDFTLFKCQCLQYPLLDLNALSWEFGEYESWDILRIFTPLTLVLGIDVTWNW